MSVIDEKTGLIYQAALDRYLQAKFLQKIFRHLLTAQYIYPSPLRRHTFPLHQSGTLFSNLALERCLKIQAHGIRCSRSTVQDTQPSHHETIKEKAHETIQNQTSQVTIHGQRIGHHVPRCDARARGAQVRRLQRRDVVCSRLQQVVATCSRFVAPNRYTLIPFKSYT